MNSLKSYEVLIKRDVRRNIAPDDGTVMRKRAHVVPRLVRVLGAK